MEEKDELVSAKEARQELLKLSKEIGLDMGSNQPNIEQKEFPKEILTKHSLLSPYYEPAKMMALVEDVPILGTCISTYVQNIHGYGYEFLYTGKNKDSMPEKEKNTLEGFFERVNEDQTFRQLVKELRWDYEAAGDAFMEVVKFPTGKISTLYRLDPRYVRRQTKQLNPVPVKVNLQRTGQHTKTTIYKYFRRYAFLISKSKETIKWFKEYGDPRKMDANTGKYEHEWDDHNKKWLTNEINEEATSIINFKQGNLTQGVPRWSGLSSTLLGLKYADQVNKDLFSEQCIPPLAVLVSGGYLTQNSVDDLKELLKSKKGVKNFHNILVLEAVSSSDNIDDKAGSTKVEFEELSTSRKEDAVFAGYIESSENRVMSRFRLSPLFLGRTADF